MSLSKHFEHKDLEPRLYAAWEEAGVFTADAESDKPAFSIAMPPPNATGQLHLGHAIFLALQDLMARWRRMAGDEVLWLPGTDHAAIATESVVIRQLQQEGMADPRGTLGRDALVERIAEFVAGSRGTIRHQIRAMGASCDWTRERYTLDPALNRVVNSVFARMYRDGLIYRGMRIVNWDPHLQTVVSDDELYHEDRQAKLYTLQYGPFKVSTSRPETKLGDTAVAVHPDDERYQEYVGQTFKVTWPRGVEIEVRVVADTEVDPELGTGVLGVTPAHSAIDFEIAERHGLPLLQVIGQDGRMTEAAGGYAGLTVKECRKAFVADLEEAGLMVEAKDYIQPISLCYRSKKEIEPLPLPQWFVDVNRPAVQWRGKLLSLRQVLRNVVESGEIKILPEHEQKTYMHWIEGLRDWCISRQIWWGHRIPVWYRGDDDIYVGNREPEGEGWKQDDQTLDTWFSSALWTWSTLLDQDLAVDPTLTLAEVLERSPDFQRFHPTTVMETGYDILFFWVARMILSTTYGVGEIPFETVYLHGLVLDDTGKKMSKSNPEKCIDPLETIEEYGADVLRMSLLIGNSAGHDLKLSKARVEGCWRLQNKIWNAAKLVQRVAADVLDQPAPQELTHPVNRWMRARRDALVRHVDQRFDAFAFGVAMEQVQSSFWSEFCDFYLEAIKVDEIANLDETAPFAAEVFRTYLQLFHPAQPYITETLWSEVGGQGMLAVSAWPTPLVAADADAEHSAGVGTTVELISALRGVRAEQGIDPGSPIEVSVVPLRHAAELQSCAPIISRLARCESLQFVEALPKTSGAAVHSKDFEAVVELGAADRERERERLQKQLEKGRKRLESVGRSLENEAFLAKAPAETVERTRREHEELAASLRSIETRLGELS